LIQISQKLKKHLKSQNISNKVRKDKTPQFLKNNLPAWGLISLSKSWYRKSKTSGVAHYLGLIYSKKFI